MKKKIKINKKLKSDLEKYPMVECRWLDIVSDASWQSVENLKSSKLATCITKGHLLSQAKGITRIFGDYSLKDNSKTDIEEVFLAFLIRAIIFYPTFFLIIIILTILFR
jgi:hypothetical protein